MPRISFKEFMPRVLDDEGKELEGADAIAMLNQTGPIRGTVFWAERGSPETKDEYFHACGYTNARRMPVEQESSEDESAVDGTVNLEPATGSSGPTTSHCAKGPSCYMSIGGFRLPGGAKMAQNCQNIPL